MSLNGNLLAARQLAVCPSATPPHPVEPIAISGPSARAATPGTPIARGLGGVSWARLLAILLVAVLVCLRPHSLHGFDFSESFEAPGYDNAGWVVPPNSPTTPDPDFASPALAASQSLRFAGGGFIQIPFVQPSQFYFYFRARWNTWEDQGNVVDWLDASPSLVASVFTGNGNTLNIVHGGVEAIGTTVLQTGTTYDIWVDWTRGTGNNGTMKLYISTTGIQPALPEASLTTGAGGAIALLDIGPFLKVNTDVIFDNIIADSQPIAPRGRTTTRHRRHECYANLRAQKRAMEAF